jgi:hypothetical protein
VKGLRIAVIPAWTLNKNFLITSDDPQKAFQGFSEFSFREHLLEPGKKVVLKNKTANSLDQRSSA